MVEIKVTYEGQLHNSAVHVPSGNTLVTDAPLDNAGLGQAFSPSDLVATALGACMSTVIGIVAKRKNLDVGGMTVDVRKFMSDDAPRRIKRLEFEVTIIPPAIPSSSPPRCPGECCDGPGSRGRCFPAAGGPDATPASVATASSQQDASANPRGFFKTCASGAASGTGV